MSLTPRTVRTDLKCGKGAIPEGKKCHKGAATKVETRPKASTAKYGKAGNTRSLKLTAQEKSALRTKGLFPARDGLARTELEMSVEKMRSRQAKPTLRMRAENAAIKHGGALSTLANTASLAATFSGNRKLARKLGEFADVAHGVKSAGNLSQGMRTKNTLQTISGALGVASSSGVASQLARKGAVAYGNSRINKRRDSLWAAGFSPDPRSDAFIGSNRKLNCGPGSKPCGNACIPRSHKCRASWNKPVKVAAGAAALTGAALVGTAFLHPRSGMRAAARSVIDPVAQAGYAAGNAARGNWTGAARNAANVAATSQNLGRDLTTLRKGYSTDIKNLYNKGKEAAFKARHHRPAKG